MAIIYYPRNSVVYARDVSGSNLTEIVLDLPPDNTIFLFTGSSYLSTSSLLVSTSSFSITSSYALNASGVTSESSSYAISSGFAPIAFENVRVVNGNLILPSNTGQWYALSVYDDGSGSYTTQLTQSTSTGSYNATGSIPYSISSSYSVTSSYALNAGGASNSTASYISESNVKIEGGQLYLLGDSGSWFRLNIHEFSVGTGSLMLTGPF